MRILVTGGAGFMGSNFIKYVFKNHPDWQVVNLDKLTYAGNLDNLKEVENHKNYKFVKGDIADRGDVKKAIGQGVDKIFNYSAETHVDRSILDPDVFVKTDILGTFTLLEVTKKYNVAQYLQISTDEVYGSIKKGLFSEKSPFEPNSPYAASKAGADLLCRAYFKTYGLSVIITHACNCYGQNQYPEKFIPLFITNLLEGKKVPVYGKGNQTREWIFVQDHCRAIDLITQKGKAGETYNIGTGYCRKNIEVVRFILAELGFDPAERGKLIEYIKDRPGHDFRYALDSEKLKKLGWMPSLSWEEGLRRTIKWYQENREWWKKIKSREYLEYYKKQYLER